MTKKVDLSMFLDFSSSIDFLKNLKNKYNIFYDTNSNIDIYNKNDYEKYLKYMPFFYLNTDKDYNFNIEFEYNLLKTIPWHYDFHLYQKVLDELNIINKNDLWNSYTYTKKYISNNDTKTINYVPNINEIIKYIPRGYLIAPIDIDNIELQIDKSKNEEVLENNDSVINQININDDIIQLYYIIIGNDITLTKDSFSKFVNNNKDFFDKLLSSNNNMSSYNDIINHYFDDNNFIELSDWKEKTLFIISSDTNKYSIYINNLINNKNNIIIEEKFINMYESTVNPINDETNTPVSRYKFFNFKDARWKKKIINMSLWLILYILIIIFIFIIVFIIIK